MASAFVLVSCGRDSSAVSDGIKATEINNLEDWAETAEEIVNVEEADLTHDGVPDKIVSYIWYGDYEDGLEKTAEEKLNSQGACIIRVYDGRQLSSDGIYEEESCIWERTYGVPHVGNGQLYLLRYNGETYLLENSDYIMQGAACFEYRVFYLNNEKEEIITEKNELPFSITEENLLYNEEAFPIEEGMAYTEALARLLKESTLLIYCNVDQNPRIRTFEKSCTAEAEEIWNWMKDYVDMEITMENLHDVLTVYYQEVWKRQ